MAVIEAYLVADVDYNHINNNMMGVIMLKGVTPVTSVILLVVVTIALVAVSYIFLLGVMAGDTEKSFIIPPNGVFCDKIAGANTISIVVINTGMVAGIGGDDFIIKKVFGSSSVYEMGSGAGDIFPPILPQQAGVIETKCGGLGCDKDNSKIRLSTGTITLETTVICP